MLKALVISLFVMSCTVPAMATCNGTVFNPVTDIAWNGLFPIRVGGVAVASNNNAPDGATGTVNPICTCTTSSGTFIGTQIGFWDVAYLVEVVDDPYCSTVVGTTVGNDNGSHQGTNDKSVATPHTFKQVHWWPFNAIQLLGMLTGLSCIQQVPLQMTYLSEIDPSWTEDWLAMLKDPKVFLVANPVADIACGAKNAIAQVPGNFFPAAYDSLFWCGWDNIYPLSGNSNSPHNLTASAQIAARQIYTNTQFGTVEDYLVDSQGCSGQIVPVWKSSQWRFQLAKPVKSSTPFWAGESELIWGSGRAPTYNDKNFLYVLFQKKRCCQKIYGGQ
ncbi:hypothetical protein FO488_00335 [Geobacter sp. FeAm09]|uniref:TraU family protein n=1 Tax=Geobacter sp. FeAm09 TaxID=2597769 RepID=UPI0011EEE457|nr:TraU family protein [Geobacter sp. FeAm09]QEM66754.1 hypothetical protein FO488_00335 [Geobacter sp. FeAm09]